MHIPFALSMPQPSTRQERLVFRKIIPNQWYFQLFNKWYSTGNWSLFLLKTCRGRVAMGFRLLHHSQTINYTKQEQNKFSLYLIHTYWQIFVRSSYFSSTNPQYDDKLFIVHESCKLRIHAVHVVDENCYFVLFRHSEQFWYTTCSPHVLQKEKLLTKIYLYLKKLASFSLQTYQSLYNWVIFQLFEWKNAYEIF